MDHPVTVESFSVTQAAEALGKSVSSLRRWISDDKIPSPRLWDVARKYHVYSAGELEVIARALAEHERDFVYLATGNSQVLERMHQAVFAYRSQFI